jgi:hypothetical protein
LADELMFLTIPSARSIIKPESGAKSVIAALQGILAQAVRGSSRIASNPTF